MIIIDDNGRTNKIATGILHFIGLILFLVCIFTMQRCYNLNQNYDEVSQLLKAANDSLTKTRNDLNEEVAKTSVLTTTNIELFTSLETKDEQILWLQKVVKDAKRENKELNSALVIATETHIRYKDSVQNVIAEWQTVDDVKYPIYKREFQLDSCFTKGSVELGLTTFNLEFTTDNKYEVVIGEEKVDWLHKKQFAQITNKNQCTTTETLKVYDKTKKKTNIFKPLGYGVGIGAILTVLLIAL